MTVEAKLGKLGGEILIRLKGDKEWRCKGSRVKFDDGKLYEMSVMRGSVVSNSIIEVMGNPDGQGGEVEGGVCLTFTHENLGLELQTD